MAVIFFSYFTKFGSFGVEDWPVKSATEMHPKNLVFSQYLIDSDIRRGYWVH